MADMIVGNPPFDGRKLTSKSPDDERLDAIRRGRWIKYSQGELILEFMEGLARHPKVPRMPNLLLIGPSNNGKSMLMQRYERRHPRQDDPKKEVSEIPFLLIEAPPKPDEEALYLAILNKLHALFPDKVKAAYRADQAIALMRATNVRALAIDEFHNFLAGPLVKQRAYLNAIKHLGNHLQIPIICIGTKAAYYGIQTDDQIVNRFPVRRLPPWRDGAEFRTLLATFEESLLLRRRSNLAGDALAARVMTMSEGYLGEIAELLKLSAERAIQKGTEQIDEKTLKTVGFTSPSDRRNEAEKVY